jgi:hypothetical protein
MVSPILLGAEDSPLKALVQRARHMRNDEAAAPDASSGLGLSPPLGLLLKRSCFNPMLQILYFESPGSTNTKRRQILAFYQSVDSDAADSQIVAYFTQSQNFFPGYRPFNDHLFLHR